ncbi:MAG: hypothetical protein NTW55_07505 [Planctomycetota bacterium]|nr:hypothetical protein [Planctomycetota bacterium]
MWMFSKDPLYGVTPIEEMLSAGQTSPADKDSLSVSGSAFDLDFSKPINFVDIYNSSVYGSRPTENRKVANTHNDYSSPVSLPCLLVTSGLPVGVCERLNASVEPFGLAGSSGGGTDANSQALGSAALVPGACLAIPLVTGDISVTVIGTVTDVVGGKVYGFGHGFSGFGAVDLPMATGQVHTVVSSMMRSFKMASALEIVGALTADESTAVCGQIGAKAKMIPLTIAVDRYNDSQKRIYNCQIADNRVFTPLVLRAVLDGAATMLGDLPPDHTIEYKVAIGIADAESISFENVSTSTGTNEMIMESVGSVTMLMNNPYKKVDIKSLDFSVRIIPKNIISHIWSVDLSDSKIKAGDQVDVSVVVESVLAGKKKYQCGFKIPQNIEPGTYDLIICGSSDYEDFLRQAAPYRFVSQDFTTLIETMNNILRIGKDKLYCILVLPSNGIAVEKAELPDLPATRALILQDPKRTIKTMPYQHWLENSIQTGTIVTDNKIMHITVEK